MMRPALILAVGAVALGACTSPVYVDKGRDEQEVPLALNSVVFQVHEAWRAAPPGCIAILPLRGPERGGELASGRIEAIRRAIYAHLAPQGRRVIKPARVDFVLAGLPDDERGDTAGLGRRLECDALLSGRVTESGAQFLGVYSRVATGADLRMVRASDGDLLWEGRHVASQHGGGLPISPVGVAMGILDAARNMDEEQTLRVIDDLARRLATTIPDDRIVALDDPAAPPTPVRAEPLVSSAARDGVDAFLADLAGQSAEERRARLIAALDDRRFGDKARIALLDALVAVEPPRAADALRYAEHLAETGDYAGALARADRAVAIAPDNAAAHFTRGRMLIKLGDLAQAEPAAIRAVALDGGNPAYLNGLGYINSLAGRMDRALAAYRMAIDASPANGFAWYNSGVILLERGEVREASDAFYGAGLAYLKSGNFGQAGKALADLRELAARGIDLADEIGTLESALAALAKKG